MTSVPAHMTRPMLNVNKSLKTYRFDLTEIVEHLESLPVPTLIREMSELDGGAQAALFDAAKDFASLDLSYFVPDEHGVLEGIAHHGKNSIPIPPFSRFCKVFCKPDGEQEESVLWGYNHFWLRKYVGPGYFVAKDCGDGEIVIDYLDIPPRKPLSWPEIQPNCQGLSRFIYCGTKDYMRRVSSRVSIGRATRDGKVMDNWFVLVRGVGPARLK